MLPDWRLALLPRMIVEVAMQHQWPTELSQVLMIDLRGNNLEWLPSIFIRSKSRPATKCQVFYSERFLIHSIPSFSGLILRHELRTSSCIPSAAETWLPFESESNRLLPLLLSFAFFPLALLGPIPASFVRV